MTIEKYTDENGKIWFKDENNNRCSSEYFGNEEAAQKSLESLKNCSNCWYCAYCSNCSNCSYIKKEKKEEKIIYEVPKIENIHQLVYAAASATQDSLNM